MIPPFIQTSVDWFFTQEEQEVLVILSGKNTGACPCSLNMTIDKEAFTKLEFLYDNSEKQPDVYVTVGKLLRPILLSRYRFSAV